MSERVKHRAILEDSDSEGDSKQKSNIADTSSLASSAKAVDLVKSRLKDQLEKSQAKSAAKNKTKADYEDDTRRKGENEASPSNKTNSIPRKRKEAPTFVPNKNLDNSSSKPSSSLLAMMKQSAPPVNAVPTGATEKPKQSHQLFNTPHASSSRPSYASNNRIRPSLPQNANDGNIPTPREIVTPSESGSGPPRNASGQASSQPIPSSTPRDEDDIPTKSHPPLRQPKPQQNSKLEKMVWDALQEICQEQIKELPVGSDGNVSNLSELINSSSSSSRAGIDISGSILKQKQTMRQHPIMLQAKLDEDLDFFDLDEEGCILIQPVIPMFPEDFPDDAEPKTWPLSWFGIEDPKIDLEKDKDDREAGKLQLEMEKEESKKDRSSSIREKSRRDKTESSKHKHETSKGSNRKSSSVHGDRHYDTNDRYEESRRHDGVQHDGAVQNYRNHSAQEVNVQEWQYDRPNRRTLQNERFEDRRSNRYDSRYNERAGRGIENREEGPPSHLSGRYGPRHDGPTSGFRGGRGRGFPPRGGFQGSLGGVGRGFQRSPSWDRPPLARPNPEPPLASGRYGPSGYDPSPHSHVGDSHKRRDLPPGDRDSGPRARGGEYPHPGNREGRYGPRVGEYPPEGQGLRHTMAKNFPPGGDRNFRPANGDNPFGYVDFSLGAGEYPAPPSCDREFERNLPPPPTGDRDFRRLDRPPFRGGYRGGGRGPSHRSDRY